MAKQDQVQKITDDANALYDSAFSDGVASVAVAPGPGISAEQEAADIAAATATLNQGIQDLQKQIADLQLAKDAEDQLLAQVKGVVDQLKLLLPQ